MGTDVLIGFGCLFFLEDGAATGVWVFVDALNFDTLARCWCVYVFALSEVDAYVVCAVAPEYEVTWLEVGGGSYVQVLHLL